jgi:hypothetical protein
MSTQFKPGDTVRGDDYARLPIGAKTVWKHCADSDGLPAEKVNFNAWREGTGLSAPIRTDAEMSLPRTITHLPDATQPEDATGAYVEPEPLKEGDAVLVWAKVEREGDDKNNFYVSVGSEDLDWRKAWVDTAAIVRPDAGQVPPWVKAIEEPMGLGAVVDAEHAGEDVRFVRVGGDDTRHPWYAWLDERSYYTDWTALKDPKVRSQGYIAGGAS